jgi:hypothetical protein
LSPISTTFLDSQRNCAFVTAAVPMGSPSPSYYYYPSVTQLDVQTLKPVRSVVFHDIMLSYQSFPFLLGDSYIAFCSSGLISVIDLDSLSVTLRL